MQSEGRPINQTLLIAAAEREWKFFKLYTNFRPNLKVAPIAAKFYARHQKFDKSLVKQEYVDLLKRVHSQSPQERNTYPETENQRYGWYLDPLIDNGYDFRLNYRTKMSPDIKLAIEMKRMTQRMR
ncbi:uncharacterized protein [Halyomorpha halys]|uniref:uncharacterized protein n=1 Tax=Halyomorpha halys TaxID=286706 RepID=UPI0006D4C8F2|nr:uncharacterized protein LOC106683909 [Halyomorpha halys]